MDDRYRINYVVQFKRAAHKPYQITVLAENLIDAVNQAVEQTGLRYSDITGAWAWYLRKSE